MATGTGLPGLALPGEVLATPPPVSNADALSSAHAWGQIAAAGNKIASAGMDSIARDVHLQKAGTTADFENANRDWYVKANDKYNGDPVGLENAARAHNDGALAEVPPWLVPHAQQFLGGTMERGLAQQLAVKRNVDDNNARQSLEFRLKTADDDAMSLASAGQLNSEQGKAALATYHGVLKTATDTGVMVQEKSDFLENNFIERAQGAVLRKDTEDIYRQQGFQAAKDYVDKSTSELGAQYKFSDKIRTQALGWLRSEEAGMRGERDSISREWGTAKPLLGTIAPETLQEMADRAYSVGAVKVGDDIRANLAAVDVNNSLRQLPDSDRLKLLQTGKYTGDAPAMLRQFEGLKLGAYYDVNHFRVGYGSDTVTRADGTIEKVTPSTRITQEDAERDLQRRTAQTQDSIRSQIGGDAWNKLSGAAQTSLTSVAYNYGSLPDRVIPAAQSGDPQAISQAILGLSGDNSGINARRRSAEAANVLASGSNGVDLTQSRPGLLALGMLKKDMSANMGQKLSDLHGAIARSEFPPMDEVNTLAGQVGLIGTPEQKTKFAEIAAMAQYGEAFTKAGPEQRAQFISEMDARMNAGAPTFERHLTDTLHAADQRITEGYKKDPYGADVRYGVGSKAIPQIDFGSKDLPVDIADRITRQNRIRADQGMPAFSIFRPAEADSVKNIINSPDIAAKVSVFSKIATLPDDVRGATLAQLGEGSTEGMVAATAGAMLPTSPAIAQSILNGQQAIKDKFAYVPKGDSEVANYSTDLAKFLPATTFSVADRADPVRGYAVASGAIKARYADLAKQEGDTAGKYSAPRLEQSVNDVTGGIGHHNGGTFIMPQPGMSQSNFDQMLWSVPNNDFAGVTTLSGDPVDANYLRSHAQLESTQSGRYNLRLGSDPLRPVYAYTGANTETPRKFVLDLRGKTVTPEGSAAYQSELTSAGATTP